MTFINSECGKALFSLFIILVSNKKSPKILKLHHRMNAKMTHLKLPPKAVQKRKTCTFKLETHFTVDSSSSSCTGEREKLSV